MINVCRNYVNSLKVILEPVKVVIQGRFWESVKRLFYASVMCRWLLLTDWREASPNQDRVCVCVRERMCDGKVVTGHGCTEEEVFQDFPSYCFLLISLLY